MTGVIQEQTIEIVEQDDLKITEVNHEATRTGQQEAIELVERDGLQLKQLAEEFKSDRQIVQVALSQNALALKHAADALKKEREIVLAAVSQHGYALAFAAEELRREREVVLTAVTQFGHALEWAVEELKADREIVLAAVSQAGGALELASEELKGDRGVVLAAVAQQPVALMFAADSLLEDESFAEEARVFFYFFKVVVLSGRSCVVALWAPEHPLYGLPNKSELLRYSCKKLGMPQTGGETLVYGTELVPDTDVSPKWPGSPALGHMTEYQLVSSKKARTT
mmetsp:Transcript_24915/g.45750  ORF Transcript_24915/g.45750 Transcript_24915/m.45750 type:complete len:283 (-) Transcript_24915:23-871(-)